MRATRRAALVVFLGTAAAGSLLGGLADRPAAVTGVVADDAGQPIAGARVRVRGECQATVTDRRGRFLLPLPAGGAALLSGWKDGYGIGAAPPTWGSVRLTLPALPAEDTDAYPWVAPDPDPTRPHNCGNCHAAIHGEWAASAHARSATNRRFLNLFAGTDWYGRPADGWSLLAQRPDGAGVCAACHAPTFRDPTFEYDFRKAAGVDRRGTHCDYCHRVVDAPTDRVGTRFGRDGLPLLRPADGCQFSFGPLDDAHRPGETFGHLPLYRESRYCASCHEGVLFGVHVYGTYSEWLESPARRAGRQCQDCHMVPTGRLTNIAPGKGGIERDPRTLASHSFPGGQADMLRRGLAVTATARMTPAGVRVAVEVRATDVGHRVPTGFIDRNLVLVVEGTDRDGNPVRLIEGPRLPRAAGKAVAAAPGQLYAKLLRGADGNGPIPFWLAHTDPEDTRLVPDRPDRSSYLFGLGAAHVRVRLLYRRFWPDVAEGRAWPDNEVVVIDRTVAPVGDGAGVW